MFLGGPNYKAGTSLDWKTRTDVILSSHYNLHYGHCIQLDISPLSPKKNGKVLMSKGITFAHMRLHVKTDQNMDMIFPSLFLHNGTDVDRLGENILGRELSSGKHDVSYFLLLISAKPICYYSTNSYTWIIYIHTFIYISLVQTEKTDCKLSANKR